MPDPMTLLKQDHREVKKLVKELGETEPGKQRNQLLDTIEENLRLHMEIEEELVYPMLAQEDAEAAEEAEIEHGLARDGLAKLRELVDKPGFGAACEMLLAGLQHHIHEEESEQLPELKSETERSEWMALGDRIVERKEQGLQGAGSAKGTTAR